MQCTRCGFVNASSGATTCAQCGQPFSIGADPAIRALLPVGRTALSIIAGYVGLASILCVPAPLALGLGIWAIIDLKKRPGMHGMGRAIFAVVAGALGTLGLIGWIVLGSTDHARR